MVGTTQKVIHFGYINIMNTMRKTNPSVTKNKHCNETILLGSKIA